MQGRKAVPQLVLRVTGLRVLNEQETRQIGSCGELAAINMGEADIDTSLDTSPDTNLTSVTTAPTRTTVSRVQA